MVLPEHSEITLEPTQVLEWFPPRCLHTPNSYGWIPRTFEEAQPKRKETPQTSLGWLLGCGSTLQKSKWSSQMKTLGLARYLLTARRIKMLTSARTRPRIRTRTWPTPTMTAMRATIDLGVLYSSLPLSYHVLLYAHSCLLLICIENTATIRLGVEDMIHLGHIVFRKFYTT